MRKNCRIYSLDLIRAVLARRGKLNDFTFVVKDLKKKGVKDRLVKLALLKVCPGLVDRYDFIRYQKVQEEAMKYGILDENYNLLRGVVKGKLVRLADGGVDAASSGSGATSAASHRQFKRGGER